jgi:hypothetical protein
MKNQSSEKFLARKHEIQTPLGVIELSNLRIGATATATALILAGIPVVKGFVEGMNEASNAPAYGIQEIKDVLEHAYVDPKILEVTNTGRTVVDSPVSSAQRTVIHVVENKELTDAAQKTDIDFWSDIHGPTENITYGDGSKLTGDVKVTKAGMDVLLDTSRVEKHGGQAKLDLYENLMSVSTDLKRQVDTNVYMGSVVVDVQSGTITSLKMVDDPKLVDTTSRVSKLS